MITPKAIAIHAAGFFLTAAAFSAGSPAKVTLTQKPESVVLANGIVSVEIGKGNGNPLALIYKGQSLLDSPGYLNWHAESDEDKEDEDEKGNNNTYTKIRNGVFNVVTDPTKNDGEMADVSISQKFPGQGAPFDVELHYALRKGDSGYYEYVIYRHPKGYPQGQLADVRMLYRLNENLFDFLSIDEQRRRFVAPPETPRISLGPKESMMMTEGPFKGAIEDKYHDYVDAGDHYVHGWEGSKSGLGCWILYGSTEDQNGGPTKQHNTAQFPRILMKILTCCHYGAAPVKVGGEAWEKLYGPFMVYLNSGSDRDGLWADAKNKAAAERAAWPYDWMRNPLYPNASGRGTVRGRLHIDDDQDRSASAANAWVGLAAPAPDWQQQSAGYQFWVHADKDGSFTIPNVRPGTYTLYAFADGVMDQFRQDGIKVDAGSAIDLKLPDWKPVRHGVQLWQIGTPDRTAKEYRHGDDYREWGLWNKYPLDFPNGVNFVIGKSNERTDWNYAQCEVQKNGQWTGTSWNVLFNLPTTPAPGTATLRIALAAAHKAALQVYVNGVRVGTNRFDTDNAMMRAGIHGQYTLWDVPFSGALLKAGQNTITLDQRSARSPQKNVIYDCLRLELAENK